MAATNSPENNPTAVVSDVLTALRWEWFRLSRRAAFRVIIGLMAAGVAVTLAVLALVGSIEGILFSPYDYPSTVVGLLGMVGPFLAVVLGSLIYGSDFGWGTWRPLTARGMRRWQIGLAKLLLAGVALAVFWAVAWTLAALVGLAAGESALDATSGDVSDGWGKTAVGLGATWLAAIAYLGLGAALTTAGRSTAFGVGVGVAVILFETVAYPLAGLAGGVFDIPVGEITRWTLWGVTSGLIDGDEAFSRWVFLGPVLGYAGLGWGLTLIGLSFRDVGGGSG